MNILGWIGTLCFCLCGVPQAIKCIQQGHARGISGLFLLFWMLGEICYTIATISEFGLVIWLLLNYILNILCISIIFYYWRKE